MNLYIGFREKGYGRMKENKGRVFYLDFIRVMAMLMMITFHFLSGVESYQLLKNPDSFKVGGISLLNLGGVNLTLGNYATSLFFILSGVCLMYAYQDDLPIRGFYTKRLFAIYPLYYISFITAYFIQIFLGYKMNYRAPFWTWILTVMGIDGWINEITPTYALIGDGIIGCLLCVYIVFPILYRWINRHPHITLGCYFMIFVFWEYIYPFEFPKRYSILLRIFEVLLGMYFIKINRKISWKGFLGSLALLGIVFIKKISVVSVYLLAPMAGISVFIILNYIAGRITNSKVQKMTSVLSRYAYAAFLMHQFLLNVVLRVFPKRSLGLGGMIGAFLICTVIIWTVGGLLKKIEINIMDDSIFRKVSI